MDSVKDVTKRGWHPKGKNSEKESWRGDFKGINQVAGWVGHGKGSGSTASSNHIATPITSLKDPSTFGPPPKTVAYHGVPASPTKPANSDTAGIGSPVSLKDEISPQQNGSNPEPPPVPFRADTTGLSTSNLPKPPIRHPGGGIEPKESTPISPKKPPPKLPPRLPPRASVASQNVSTGTSIGKPTQQEYINQGALNRLGSAGISVPGLGIGATTKSSTTATKTESPTNADPETSTDKLNMSSLQQRLAKLPTSSHPASNTNSPSEGTSFADKQAAFRTASQFRNDPSSVSLADAKKAAVVGNNFRERHGDQVATGLKTGKSMNEKYGIASKLSGFSSGLQERGASEGNTITQMAAANQTTTIAPTPASPGKKQPPPLPPKKTVLQDGAGVASKPPPVPLATKPK